jgi:hypothetical protein
MHTPAGRAGHGLKILVFRRIVGNPALYLQSRIGAAVEKGRIESLNRSLRDFTSTKSIAIFYSALTPRSHSRASEKSGDLGHTKRQACSCTDLAAGNGDWLGSSFPSRRLGKCLPAELGNHVLFGIQCRCPLHDVLRSHQMRDFDTRNRCGKWFGRLRVDLPRRCHFSAAFEIVLDRNESVRNANKSEATRKRVVIMSAPSDDNTDPELNKYAPKWSRQQPATPETERPPSYLNMAATCPRAAGTAGGWDTGADGPDGEGGCICGFGRLVGHLWETAIATSRAARTRITDNAGLQTI